MYPKLEKYAIMFVGTKKYGGDILTQFEKELSSFLLAQGASDVGFCSVPDGPGGLCGAVSIVLRLSDAIVDEIDDAPTYTYFHHYRTVNAFLDRLALECGIRLARKGYNYLTVAASQSVPAHLEQPFQGRYSHKKVARLAGLGSIGKNALFLHKTFGARVRLVTVFTDCEFEPCALPAFDVCTECGRCVSACPAGAISGERRISGEDVVFNPQRCSTHMKTAYQNIGRGAVCGICMKVCPAYNKMNK